MNRLLSAEALKLRTTRTPWLMAGVAVLLGTGITSAVSATLKAGTADPLAAAASPGGIVLTMSILLGILVLTTEFRHETATASLLAAPDRARFVLAKAGVSMGVCLGLGLLVTGAATVIAATVLQSRGIATGADAGTYAQMVLGGGVAAALAAGMGVGLGALVRNQVGAIVGVLVWLYMIEQLLLYVPGIGDAIARYGIVGLSSAVTQTSSPKTGVELLGQGPALLALATWTVALLAAGTAVLRRSDVH